MRTFLTICLSLVLVMNLQAGSVEKTFTFSKVSINQRGLYQTVTLENTMAAGLNGEPMMPYHTIAMMLPPGEKALSVRFEGSELTQIPGSFNLFPQQMMQPLSKGSDGVFIKKDAIYQSAAGYPVNPVGTLINSYLNGYAFALSTFTPVVYHPSAQSLSYYRKVTIIINTVPDPQAKAALQNLTSSESALKRVRMFAQNPDMMQRYPLKNSLKTNYKVLIITPAQYQSGFQELADYYASQGKATQIATTESISTMAGNDMQEKIRNYIISEYQTNGIEHVILGGDVEYIPYRGFYCYVVSGSGYEDYNIPADIYYSALDGNWNTNGNNKWGEPGEDDLLPEISVGRMSFSNATELANMVHKSVFYQGYPVYEPMKRPFMVSEFLYDPPMTWGSDYLELLIDDHNDNGYFTHGIPSAENNITRLYDTTGYNWSVGQLLAGINSGKAFIHHCGHSNATYMMRLSNWDITDQNFYQVNGVNHNYQLMYTHGCICGAFDESDCISERAVAIANFLAGGVFNSRYGWFDQGTTEGPSAHLHREFISALYNPNPDSAILELGAAHTMSKIMTAPWVGLPGEFEPGAQRWCHYDCNVLGDPALKIWVDNPIVGTPEPVTAQGLTITPNPCKDRVTISWTALTDGPVTLTLLNGTGREVYSTTIAGRAGSQSVNVDLPSLASGVYICRLLSSGNFSLTKKVVVIR